MMGVCPAAAVEPISVLALGSVDPSQSPVTTWLSTDPNFELSLVPTRLYDVEAITPDQARRMLRLYFPRNEKAMSAYDFLLFSGGDVRYFQPSHIQMMVSAVEAGAGSATDMGGMSRPLHDTWIASGMYVVFPNDVFTVDRIWDFGTPADLDFRIEVNDALDSNPLLPFVPLGIEKLLGGRTRIIKPMEGSTIYAWMDSESLLGADLGFRPAACVIWEYGQGRSIAFEAWLGHSWWSSIIDPSRNEYGQDILINYVLDASGRRYLEEIALVHALRQSYISFNQHLSFLTNLFDFVERFGANVGPLSADAREVQAGIEDSQARYLDGDVEDALRISEDLMSALRELRERAMRVRDRALQWIYVIQWLSVTATLMIAGYTLDQLMVRRKLYRSAQTTRHRTS